jgi:hypothetical protein
MVANFPVVVDGIFTGEIHAATVTLTEYALFSGKLSATYVEIGWAIQW